MTSEVHPWFDSLIRRCLATLYLLNLDGCPAADALDKAGTLWVRLLWEKPRSGWIESQDDARIRKAFAHIAHTAKRWPSPMVFWDCIEDRAPPPRHATRDGLLAPDWGRENEAEALGIMVRQFAELGRDRYGSLIEADA
jgi:hypothetical protein